MKKMYAIRDILRKTKHPPDAGMNHITPKPEQMHSFVRMHNVNDVNCAALVGS